MKRLVWFACIVLSIAWQPVWAQSPLRVREGLRMPSVLLQPAPAAWISLYEQVHTDLHSLVAYVDPANLRNPESKVYPPGVDRLGAMGYALYLLGDFGGVDLIPVLRDFAEKYRRGDALHGPCKQTAFALELTAERIRYRAMGRDAYVQEMIRWVRTPRPDPPGGDASIERMDRIFAGARALGVIKAREAVPVLMELLEKEWRDSPWSLFLVRPLARIGDPRAMPALEYEMLHSFTKFAPAEQVPLEAGEPDPCVVYWQMRTQGMTITQAIADLIGSMAESGTQLKEPDVIRHLVGPIAVPQLLKALREPPAGRDSDIAQGFAAILLGEWRTLEAVPDLRQLLRGSTHRFVRQCAAEALGAIADASALEDLIAAACDKSEHIMVRQLATRALSHYRKPEVTNVLLNLATDEQVWVVALDALKECGTPAIIPALEQLHDTASGDLRKRAIASTIKRIQERLR